VLHDRLILVILESGTSAEHVDVLSIR